MNFNKKIDELFSDKRDPKVVKEDQEDQENPLDDIDRAIYFTLELVKGALEGDEKSVGAIAKINDLMDGRMGNLDRQKLRIADKRETMDDKKIGRSPYLKQMFLDVFKDLNQASKDSVDK